MEQNVTTDDDFNITDLQADELCELGNIGTAHAATTLSTMLSTYINICVPNIVLVNLGNLQQHLDDVTSVIVLFKIQGQVTNDGYLFVHLPTESTIRMTNIMLGKTDIDRELDEMDLSAVTEIGNIMTSSFLDACATMLNIIMLPSPPSLVVDMPHAAVQTLIASQELEEEIDKVVLFKTELTCAEHAIQANILLLPGRKLLYELFERLNNIVPPQ